MDSFTYLNNNNQTQTFQALELIDQSNDKTHSLVFRGENLTGSAD